MSEKTILFLYTRLPDYTYKSIEYFSKQYDGKITIIRYEEDINAKYKFQKNDHISLLYKDENLSATIDGIDPGIIIISGWNDKQYVSIARKYVPKIPVTLSLDNPWNGTLKQRILCLVSPLYIHKFCNSVWVPGIPQYEYAKRLGFKKPQIFTNLYAADTDKFDKILNNPKTGEKEAYPRMIVYLGRLVKYKQPHLLARIFQELVDESNLNWKLTIVGSGPLKDQIILANYKNVLVREFMDPSDIPEFYSGAGVFCLPSKNEHWGVAVHEAAAAGLPLLLSNSVGAATEFLIDNFNGFLFKSGSKDSFKKALNKIMNMSDEELRTMGKNSVKLSRRISHDTWAANLNSIIKSRQY